MSSSGPYRVGYWLSAKKCRTLRLDEFAAYCAERGVTLVPIDLERELGAQGPFHCIVHKLSDVCASAEAGDERARRQWDAFTNYVASIDCPVLDPPDALALLCSRATQYEFLASLCTDEGGMRAPPFVQLVSENGRTNVSKARMYGLQYPLVCKPLPAHGSANAHQITLVFNAAGLASLAAPFVAQSFCAHNGVLFKVFVMGDRHFVMRRPSLKNYTAGEGANMEFDSQSVSKAGSSSTLTDGEDVPHVDAPPTALLDKFVHRVRARSGLSLFGVDVIACGASFYAIDVNVFPSYAGVEHMFAHLLTTITSAVLATSTTDSGLGTTSESEMSDMHRANSAHSNSFPDWQRIKRFYGIPKPHHAPLPPPRRSKQTPKETKPIQTHSLAVPNVIKTRTNSMP